MYIADMHCDTIMKIWFSHRGGKPLHLKDTEKSYEELMIDLSKLKIGGSLVQNFAIFIDLALPEGFNGENGTSGILSSVAETAGKLSPWTQFNEMAKIYHEEIAANSDIIREALSYEDIEANKNEGLISSVLTIEEGGVLEGDTDRLQTLYDEGVRMMTLTWNYENELAYPNTPPAESKQDFSQYFKFVSRTDNGLKNKGREAVEIMQELGIIVDVSHLSDAGFYDVAGIVKGPFVASHSNARAVCGCNRNLTDEMIRTVAGHGGVIGLNFCPVFVEEASREEDCRMTVDLLAKHARHMMNIGGVSVVGLGTDFDGIGKRSVEIANASMMPKLVKGLERCGFNYDEIEHICYRNVLDVYREVL